MRLFELLPDVCHVDAVDDRNLQSRRPEIAAVKGQISEHAEAGKW
jgi:hypothetical protein